jgi:hypothetical protein
MSKNTLFSVGLGGAFALAATLAAPAAHADPLRYSYVALDQVSLPAPYEFFSPSVVVGGTVYGVVSDSTFSINAVAAYRNGTVTIGPAGTATVANASGIMGGQDPNFRAALFNGDATTLVPQLPGETSANVVGLADNGLALVSSFNGSGTTFAYFDKGVESPIDFGLPDPVFSPSMNQQGQIGATKQESPIDHFLHGYRFDPATATSTLLPPFAADPTDINVLIQGIDNSGEVLGYSFTDFESPAYHERIGIWDKSAVFHPYFEETINTNLLAFNERDEIVISFSSDAHSYLVPAPGTRLDLGSLVSNLPAGLEPFFCFSIDNAGDITGLAADADFNLFPFLLVPNPSGAGNPPPAQVSNHPMPASHARDIEKGHRHK